MESIRTVQGGEIPFLDIDKYFATTKAAKILEGNGRFADYMEVDLEEWRRVLGSDVNNLSHLVLTYRLTKAFLKRMEMPLEDREVLLLTAIIHDWAEAITGDICSLKKTIADAVVESALLENILRKYFCSVLSSETISRVIEVLDNDKEGLGNVFRCIEILGFFRTSLIAWERRMKIQDGHEENLMEMTQNVVGNRLAVLVEYSKEFPQVGDFLESRGAVIEDAFEKMPDGIFENYVEEERDNERKKFENAKGVWKEFKRLRKEQIC